MIGDSLYTPSDPQNRMKIVRIQPYYRGGVQYRFKYAVLVNGKKVYWREENISAQPLTAEQMPGPKQTTLHDHKYSRILSDEMDRRFPYLNDEFIQFFAHTMKLPDGSYDRKRFRLLLRAQVQKRIAGYIKQFDPKYYKQRYAEAIIQHKKTEYKKRIKL